MDGEGQVSEVSKLTGSLTETKLLEYLEVIRVLFANSTDMMWVLFGDRFIWSNAESARQLGFDAPEDLLGLSPADISPEQQPGGMPSGERALEEIHSAIDLGHHRFEWFHQHCNGDLIPCEIILTAIPLVNDVALLAIGRNLSLVKEVEQRLKRSQFVDVLTGLPNRRALVKSLETQLSERTAPLSLVCIGLDQFKRINEEFGFRTGDKVLKLVSRRLAGRVGEQGALGRFHGDTFVVVLPGKTQAEALQWSEALLEYLCEPISLASFTLGLQCSLGVAHFKESEDARTLLQHAESAMFQAKHSSGPKLCCYSARLAAEQAQERNLVNEIRDALERKEFFLVYQPVFHLDSGLITGAEALLRWRHPLRGVLSPDAFIEQAEQSGQIVEMGRQVLEMASVQMRRWLDQGLPLKQVSVNISVRQIEHGDLVESMLDTLARHRIPPECMEVEVTESMLLQQGKTMAAQLWKLRQAGVAIAIDDFGTGYSSFGRLKTLPVDRVKIDRSFVRELENDERNASIIQAIIALAHNLEMVVTAEGIETQYQYQFLRSQRCEAGQGYLISPPVAPVRFEHLVRQRWQQFCRTPVKSD